MSHCQQCGACCASYRVDFSVHELDDNGGKVPSGLAVEVNDAICRMRGTDLVTTDVWTSMGVEAENEERRKAFADWCVDTDMMKVAKPDALFMHCLPAHRGEEVEADVIDGPQSVVWDCLLYTSPSPRDS